tara:strand:- start:69 stop:287 length:219 start_codon:yes stop_codon:yes gene_type:complete
LGAGDDAVASGMAASLEVSLEWAVSFFSRNTELSLELWTVITGISEFDDSDKVTISALLEEIKELRRELKDR